MRPLIGRMLRVKATMRAGSSVQNGQVEGACRTIAGYEAMHAIRKSADAAHDRFAPEGR